MKKLCSLIIMATSLIILTSCGTTRTVNTSYNPNGMTEKTISTSNSFGKKDLVKLKEEWVYDMLIETGEAPVLNKYEQDSRNILLARKGAILEAQRKLAERIGTIRLNATTTMQDFATSDIVQSRINVYLQDVQVLSEEHLKDKGLYSVSIQMPKLKVINVLEEYFNQ